MNDILFKDILDIYNNEIRKNVKNKRKIYEFEKYKITYLNSIYKTIKNNNIPDINYNIFLIHEPKYRIIMSISIYDKIINHYLAKYILNKRLDKYLDFRNVATRKNMGSSYGISLVKKYINELKSKYDNFYILKLDISKYFYSIDHEVLKKLLKEKLLDNEYKMISKVIDSTDKDYINKSINSLKEKEIIRNKKREKEIEELPFYEKGKGLAIGLMTNQFLAIFYLYELHLYIIHKLKLKYMVIYMDDYIIMHHDKKYLKNCLERIKYILEEEYKLKINSKKTSVTSIKEGFIFLQYRFKVINNKTIIKLRRESVNRIRNNIKNRKKDFNNDKISFEKYFSTINNYKYTFKYDKIKVSRIIDRVV